MNRSNGIVSVRDLAYAYHGATESVFDGLDLDIEAGQITAILGPNGSGKTTLLRLLLGVLRPRRGAIHLAGRAQTGYSRRELSQLVGLVPQDEHIPFDFTILEYVLLGRAPYLGPLAQPGDDDLEMALEALHTTGLESMHDRPLPKLSGGERQLATLARALAQKPRILLLDEPTAHLDLGNQGRLLEIMAGLAQRGVTLILTTHDPNLAASIASQAVLINGHGILDAGPTAAVLTAETLSATYGLPVEVVQANGRRVILLAQAHTKRGDPK